jgi:hypothetical protein
MENALGKDRTGQAREALDAALADLTAATKKAIGDDGRIFFGATSALEVAVESLFPPHRDAQLAAQSCREALKLVKLTRAYASREAGGSTAKLIEQATKKIEGVLEALQS